MRPYYLRTNSFFTTDGEVYELHARAISAILTEKPCEYISQLRVASHWVSAWIQRCMVPPANIYQMGHVTYFYGILYSIFGYHELIIHIWNIILHLLSGILIFKLTRNLFDYKTEIISTILFLFNPTLFYYSTAKVAESSCIFLISLIMFLLVSLGKTKRGIIFNFLKIIILISALFLFFLLKEKFLFPLMISIWAYMALSLILYYKKLKWFLYFMLFSSPFYYQKLLSFFDYAFRALSFSHSNYLSSGGQTYNLFIFGNDWHHYTIIEKLGYMLFAWIHFIIEPTQYTTILYLLYYPFKLIFIILSILAFFGMIISIKSRNAPALLLIFYLFFMGTMVAGASGNAGTMLRHRDIVSFVIFIFAAFFLNTMFKFLNKNLKIGKYI